MTEQLDVLPLVCPTCGHDGALHLRRVPPLRWFSCVVCGQIYSLREREQRLGDWPAPSTDYPTLGELVTWLDAATAPGTDGCEVAHDEFCAHGAPSWFVYLGMREPTETRFNEKERHHEQG